MLPPKYAHIPWVRVRGSDGLDNAHDHSRSSKQGSGILRGERVGYFPRADQHAGNRRNRHGFSISALGVSTVALESISKKPATRCALSVGDIIRRHDGKSYIVCKVWFDDKTGHWIADESPLQEL
jgi:hypothetical protein